MTCDYILMASDTDKLENGFGGHGDWTCLKCFYEKHGDACSGDCDECLYGEFYVNINPKMGVVEFECKDPAYAEDLINAFARTMNGEE